MNKLPAYIRQIDYIDTLHSITLEIDRDKLTLVTLELDETFKVSQKVMLGIKSTNISIAKNFMGKISDSNQLDAIITDIQVGHLLCSVKLQSYSNHFEVLITKDAYLSMRLQIQDAVTLLIRAHEISILEVIE